MVIVLTASKSTCACYFEKSWCRVAWATPRNCSKFSSMEPVFPDYISFYDYVSFVPQLFFWKVFTKCLVYHSWDPPPPPPSQLFKKGVEIKFWLPDDSPERGNHLENLKKGGWKYGVGAGLLNGGGGGGGWSWHFFYLIFSRFIIFTFGSYFTLCKNVLCIWRKKFFSVTIILGKKVILSCLKYPIN